MRTKTSNKKKVVCLAFCAFCVFYAFYAHKKHLRGGKSLVCILCFFVLFMLFVLFVLFVRVKSFCKKQNCPDTLIYITTYIHPITNMIFFCNLFQLSQSFSFITIFFSLSTTCNTIFMKISQSIYSII